MQSCAMPLLGLVLDVLEGSNQWSYTLSGLWVVDLVVLLIILSSPGIVSAVTAIDQVLGGKLGQDSLVLGVVGSWRLGGCWLRLQGPDINEVAILGQQLSQYRLVAGTLTWRSVLQSSGEPRSHAGYPERRSVEYLAQHR